MKITEVEAIELSLPEKEVSEAKYSSAQDAVVVKVHTDEGIIGIGDSYSSPHVVKALIEAPLSGASASGLERLIVGKNGSSAFMSPSIFCWPLCIAAAAIISRLLSLDQRS